MLDFSLKILAFLAVLVLRPLANVTNPLFRKNMGIRYFTMVQLIFGMFLWSYAHVATSNGETPLAQYLYSKGWFKTGDFVANKHLARKAVDVVGLAYSILATRILVAAFKREKQGQPWHSMSRGESRFGSENIWPELGVSIAVFGILFALSPSAALLFFVSRAIAIYMHLKDQRMALIQYYDRMDATIEKKFLNLENVTPRPLGQTLGFQLMLPKHIKGEQRINVAKVLGGQMPKLD